MLDKSFHHELEKYISDYLEIMKHWKKGGSPRAHQILKYENPYDFFYGFAVGEIEGFSSGFFQGIYNRLPNEHEFREIEEIIEVHYKDMRGILSKSMK